MVIELRVVQFWCEIKLVITNHTPATRSCDFVITRLISHQIALHSTSYPGSYLWERPILVPRTTLGRPSQWPWVRLLICLGIPTQRLGRKAYVLLLKNMATAMNATVRGRQKQYILHLQKQIILKLS